MFEPNPIWLGSQYIPRKFAQGFDLTWEVPSTFPKGDRGKFIGRSKNRRVLSDAAEEESWSQRYSEGRGSGYLGGFWIGRISACSTVTNSTQSRPGNRVL